MRSDDDGSDPDPRRIRTRDDFVRALQLLRSRSGLSYEAMERAARNLPRRTDGLPWEILPKSVVGEIVTGKRLPSRQRLRTFLAVCQIKPINIPAWLSALERVTRSRLQEQTTDLSLNELIESGYRTRVRELAPSNLEGRREEIQELIDFCSSDLQYKIWTGLPWSGKSALFSWFTINHPSHIGTVSFFVSSTRAAYSDWRGFLDVVTLQLGSIIAGNTQFQIGDSIRNDLALHGLLLKAAQAAQSRDQVLLLLVDGIDEDRSLNPSSSDPSITSLLPKELPQNVKIAISRRPYPPWPLDLPEDHPARSAPTATLAPWSGAVGARHAAHEALFDSAQWSARAC